MPLHTSPKQLLKCKSWPLYDIMIPGFRVRSIVEAIEAKQKQPPAPPLHLLHRPPATPQQQRPPAPQNDLERVYTRNKDNWEKKLSLSHDCPDSWLTGRRVGGDFKLFCRVCTLAHTDTEFATGVSTALLGNLKRHALSDAHQTALDKAGFPNRSNDDKLAPTCQQFQTVLDRRKASPKEAFSAGIQGLGNRKKITRMRLCLGKAMFASDRNFLRTAVSVALHQDVKAHDLYVRFRASNEKLQVRKGLLGIRSLGNSSGAFRLAEIVKEMVSEFCEDHKGVVDEGLLDHLRNVIELLDSDAAEDEQVSLRVLVNSRFFRNMKVTMRDKTHAARRIGLCV